MKRLPLLSLFICLFCVFGGLAHAQDLRDEGGERSTYSLDSLYFYGSSGYSDQTISAGETVHVVAYIDATGSWNTTAPIDQIYLFGYTATPPTEGTFTDFYEITSWANVAIDGQKLEFTFSAPSSWETDNQTFTLYLDGKATLFHQAEITETYISVGGGTAMTDIDDRGFLYGLVEIDETEPEMIEGACYATTLNTVLLIFDESVDFDTLHCPAANFALSGGGIVGSIVGDTLTGGDDTWMLVLADNLPNRGWMGTITYTQSGGDDVLEDPSGNQVATHSIDTDYESIVPATPVLTSPTATTDLSGVSMNWTGTAESDSDDPSMNRVILQGSLTSSTSGFSDLDTDSDASDSSYGDNWVISSHYRYYRLKAVDDNGKVSYSSSASSVDFLAAHRLALSGTVNQSPDTYEDQITLDVTDSYGTSVNATVTVSLSKTAGSGTVTFRETPGGSNTTVLDIIDDNQATFYMAADEPDTYTIKANTASLVYDELSCTVADTSTPTMVQASCYATSLTTLDLVFSETVTESGGDCGSNFSAGGVTGSSLTGSGTEWTLTLSGNLPSRGWTGNVVYDRDASAARVIDASSNEIADEHTITTQSEQIAPATPSITAPTLTTDLSGGTVSWTGTADAGATDPSLIALRLQGSADDTNWTTVDSDTDLADGTYSGSYSPGTEYAYYRVLAEDDGSNTAASSSVGSFLSAQRIELAGTVDQQPNTYEDAITLTVRDAYGNARNTTSTISLSKVSGSGTVTFRATPEGSNITTIDLVGESGSTFYMAADAVDGYTIRANSAALIQDDLACTIASGAAAGILVKLPGQTFTSGVGLSGSPTLRTAGSSFNVMLYIVDESFYPVTDEDDARDIDFTCGASNSPDGDQPTINGQVAASWNNISVSFTDGISGNIPVILYSTEEDLTITADDDTPGDELNGTESATFDVGASTSDHLVFSLDGNSLESGATWTGTNTVTVKDRYGNVKTNFNAAVTNITLTATPQGVGVVSSLLVGSRGDAVLDLAGDFTSGVCNLTTLGVVLTATADTYTIDGTSTLPEVDSNTTDDKLIAVNAPTISNASPAWRTHLDASASSPGYLLSASVDENGETLAVYYAFDNDTTKFSGYDYENSSSVTTSGGSIQLFLSGATMHSIGDGYDYMFFWIGGTDAEGNSPDGYPVAASRMVYLINPTLDICATDVCTGLHPSTTYNELLSIQLDAEMAGAVNTITRMDFTKTSTSNATATHVSGFRLWNDVNGNGLYDAGTDTQIGSTVNGTVNPSFTGLSFATTYPTTKYLLLTVDVTAAASPNQTLGMQLTDENDVVLQQSADDLNPCAAWPLPAANGDHTLPVEISSFEGSADYGANTLNWRTESEINSHGFRIYRAETSNNEVVPATSSFYPVTDWNEDANLLGHEYSNEIHDYTWVDEHIQAGTWYVYRLEAVDLDGTSEMHDELVWIESMTPPTALSLEANYPNPFNPTTTISFVLPESGQVKLSVYNIQGQLVRTLVNGQMSWGRHNVVWDSRNQHGIEMASGSYIYLLDTPSGRQVRRMLLIR